MQPRSQHGFGKWRSDLAKINEQTKGIAWVVGVFLHCCLWASPTQWASLVLKDRCLDLFTEGYVVVVTLLSGVIYFFAPSVLFASFSTWFSAGTVIVMLHIVLLQRVFEIASPERSILLFMCNVVQILFMYATWYHLGGVSGPLLKSILTFAIFDHAKTMPHVAITQIATDFVEERR